MRLGEFPNLDSFCMKVKTYLHFLSTSIEIICHFNGTICPFSYGCFRYSKVLTFYTCVKTNDSKHLISSTGPI